MKTYLLLVIAAALVSTARGTCDACLDGRCLTKHPLPEVGADLIIHRNTNVYYFTGRTNGHYYITQCNLSTLTCNKIVVPWDLWGLTVDQRTGDLYARGSWGRGLYKVDLVKNERALLVEKYIQAMFFKDKLYYSENNNNGLYTYDGGIQQIVPGTEDYVVSDVVVDKNDDVYFEHFNDGTHCIRQVKNGTGTANYFCGESYELSMDKDGYAMLFGKLSYAIYRVINDELVEVGAVTDNKYSPIFDGDNHLIYVAGGTDPHWLKQETDMQCSTGRDTRQRQIFPKPIRTTTGSSNN